MHKPTHHQQKNEFIHDVRFLFTSGCGDRILVVILVVSLITFQSQLKYKKTSTRPWNLWFEEKVFSRWLKWSCSMQFPALPAVKVYSVLYKAKKKIQRTKKEKKWKQFKLSSNSNALGLYQLCPFWGVPRNITSSWCEKDTWLRHFLIMCFFLRSRVEYGPKHFSSV